MNTIPKLDIILNRNANHLHRMSQPQMIEFLTDKKTAEEYMSMRRCQCNENQEYNEMLFRKIIENLIGREEYKKLGLRKKPFYNKVHDLYVLKQLDYFFLEIKNNSI